MKKIHEDAQVLINPNFVSDEEDRMHSATQQAIDSVKDQVEELKKDYKELIDLCQQKRDLFIVSVKFHMTTRQVSCVYLLLCVLLYICFNNNPAYHIVGNFGEHQIWRNSPQMVLVNFKFGDLNAVRHYTHMR